MPKITVHRLTDLPPVIASSVGESVGNSQRFNLMSTSVTRRLYTIRVEGPHEPGVYVVQIHALGGGVLRSLPVAVPYGSENGMITAEIVGPIFGEFVIDIVKVADVPKLLPPTTDASGPESEPASTESPASAEPPG